MRILPLPAVAMVGGGLPAPGTFTLSRLTAPSLPQEPDEQTRARALIARLKQQIARLEDSQHRLEPRSPWQSRVPRPGTKWSLGLAEVDAHLPEQGLGTHGLHDVAPAGYGNSPAAMGFALSLAKLRLDSDPKARPVLWCRLAFECQEHGKLYGHGLVSLGLPREKLLTLSLKNQVSLFWTMEEALKSGCFACVVSDVAAQHSSLTITRRLALSAAEGHSSGVMVLSRLYENATASTSRWRIATAPSPPQDLDPRAPGPPAWEVTLSRIRGGHPGHWTLCWQPPSSTNPSNSHASHHFRLVSGISGTALPQGTAQAESPQPSRRPALRTG
jgi:protein ImuA